MFLISITPRLRFFFVLTTALPRFVSLSVTGWVGRARCSRQPRRTGSFAGSWLPRPRSAGHHGAVVSLTEMLSLFLSPTLSADRFCQRAVNEAAIKRLIGGLPRSAGMGIRERLSKCHSPQG